LDEADFSTKMRGYDPFEVDELLDRAGQEINSLRAALKSAANRADMAEARLEAELGPAREARTETEAALVDAEAESDRIRQEATSEAGRIRDAAEVELRKAVEDRRQQLITETEELLRARDAARDDIDMDQQHVRAYCDRILAAVADLTRLAESMGTRSPEQVDALGETDHVVQKDSGSYMRPNS